MAVRTLSRRDVDFLLFDWLDLGALIGRERFREHSAETVAAVLDLAQRIAETEFLACYKASDRDEPRLEADGVRIHPGVRRALQAFAEAGLPAGPFDAELGGLQLPEAVHAAVMAYCMAANVAAAAYPMLSIGNARLIAAFGTGPQIEAFARPQVAGAMLGTMCLSEPQAGSSLADIATRAVPDGEDGLGRRFRLSGNKMWISGGDHDITADIVHLVLAKIPDAEGRLPEGTAGISLFAVPKLIPTAGAPEPNDVAVAGLNHKMGYRGTSNCLLNFGEGTRHRPFGRPGAVGYLIGEPGRGLAIMFQMMNEARIAIGLGAAALACRAHLLSVDYAGERRQGRAPGNRSGGPVPILEHPDVRRMLLAQKCYADGALALVLYAARLVDEVHTARDAAERDEAQACLDLLTPVAKTWPSEWGLAANDLAIQIHGGYGYTRDFDVEQLYRDNRLNPIHEGTTGIQAIDLVGRKLRRDRGSGLAILRARVDASLRSAASAGLGREAEAVARAWDAVAATAGLLIERPDEAALWNATPFLSAFGHAVVGWLWLDQAVCAARLGEGGGLFGEAKRGCCRFFVEAELPKAELWLRLAADNSDLAATLPPGCFTS